MDTTEFRAAVEKIIGVPASPIARGNTGWDLLTNYGLLEVAHGVRFSLYLRFLQGPLPGLGENPHSGTWHIYAEQFNDDPEAVLKELARRLAAAGYEPPAAVKPMSATPTPRTDGYAISNLPERIYLCFGLGDGETADFREMVRETDDSLEDVSWCLHQVDDCDPTYIREDIANEKLAAAADKRRLDWLEKDGFQLLYNDRDKPGVECASDGRTYFADTLREAIDAALAAETKPES